MIEFFKSDFVRLHQDKIHFGLDYKHMDNQYFFCLGDKMLFIHNSRKYYQIMASVQCGFEPMFHDSVFEVLFSSPDINETVQMYKGYCLRLLEIDSELY